MKNQKLTIKQTNFCLKYIELGNASEAYRQSYDAQNMKQETIHSRAYELLANSEVAARVEQLTNKHIERHMVTVDSLTEELEQARLLALRTDTAAPMVSATLGKAKLHGLLADKVNIGGQKDNPLFGASDDEIIARYHQQLKDKA